LRKTLKRLWDILHKQNIMRSQRSSIVCGVFHIPKWSYIHRYRHSYMLLQSLKVFWGATSSYDPEVLYGLADNGKLERTLETIV
jgi:hypothetical protein